MKQLAIIAAFIVLANCTSWYKASLGCDGAKSPPHKETKK
jgi:hypothetical protein